MLRRCRKGCFGHEGGPPGALSKELSSTYLSWESLLSLCVYSPVNPTCHLSTLATKPYYFLASHLMLLQSRKGCSGHGRGPFYALPEELSSTYLSWESLLSLCAAPWVRLSQSQVRWSRVPRCRALCFGVAGKVVSGTKGAPSVPSPKS